MVFLHLIVACKSNVGDKGTWLNECMPGPFCHEILICYQGVCHRPEDVPSVHDGGSVFDGGTQEDGGINEDGGVPDGGLSPGYPCNSATDCLSNHCKDGVCCNSVCDDTCEKCNFASSAGACLIVRNAVDADSCPTTCDANGQCDCPNDMVLIPTKQFCIDKYEASEGPNGKAQSIYSEYPWVNINWTNAKDACEAAGKRLCTADEWKDACQGPGTTIYPYGNIYEPRTCNGNNLWDGGGTEAAMPTGSMVGCQGGYTGLFDMSGNVREWVSTRIDGGYPVLGGAYLSGPVGLMCDNTYGSGQGSVNDGMGFRCCMSR